MIAGCRALTGGHIPRKHGSLHVSARRAGAAQAVDVTEAYPCVSSDSIL